jgi:hypothetical protein
MLGLEKIVAGAKVRGLAGALPVEVVRVEWIGADALNVVYRGTDGPAEVLLFRDAEPRLELVCRSSATLSGWRSTCSVNDQIRFLADRLLRPLTLAVGPGLTPSALHIGHGQNAFEVVVLAAAGKPTASALQAGWKTRRGGRASPILLIALYSDKAALCGPTGEDPPVRYDIDQGQVERLCRAALDQPDRHSALAFISQALPSLDTAVPGLRNEGLFASHALTIDAQRRPEWARASEKGERLLRERAMTFSRASASRSNE